MKINGVLFNEGSEAAKMEKQRVLGERIEAEKSAKDSSTDSRAKAVTPVLLEAEKL